MLSVKVIKNKEKLFYRLQETKLKITVQCEIMDRILENSLTTLVGKQVKSKQGLELVNSILYQCQFSGFDYGTLVMKNVNICGSWLMDIWKNAIVSELFCESKFKN